MKNGLLEILRTGKPPGFKGLAADPQSPDAAIPRALKQMEQTQSARAIAKGAGWSVNQLKETWKV